MLEKTNLIHDFDKKMIDFRHGPGETYSIRKYNYANDQFEAWPRRGQFNI